MLSRILRPAARLKAPVGQMQGPEQYARDMAHQRDLERCGWRFFRLRASEFYRHPEAALEPLRKLPQERGIWPTRAA
jgi:hypothetical protein